MIETVIKWLTGFSPQAQAAIIAAIVGLLTGSIGPIAKHLLDRWSLHHRLSAEHEYEERKKLRSLIGRYHGRVLEAAESLNHRLWNLQENQDRGWLELDGQFDKMADFYYFRTTIYRFLELLGRLKKFQEEAIYIDARIAKKSDLEFLQYAKALEWVITDVALFDGMNYDNYHATDHLFKGHVAVACDACCEGENPISLATFEDRIRNGLIERALYPINCLFDGLAADGRPRWDRIVAFHLLLCAFINAFGYPMQRTSTAQLSQLASTIQHEQIPRNLIKWLNRLGIGERKEGKSLKSLLENVALQHPSA